MKKLISFYFLLFISLFFASSVFSATWIVQVSDFSFSPSNLNVSVGDSIKWQWLNGIHTTTSTNIPAGAPVWDEPMTVSNQTFIYVVTVPGPYDYQCTPHSFNMTGSFTANPIGIKNEGSKIPAAFNLYQNYPNPFNPVTEIRFDLPKSLFVNLTVFNIVGGNVEVLINENLEAGTYSVDWNASQYPSGIYFYKFSSGDFVQTRKMILVK